MKRNNPLPKTRKAGTQAKKRHAAGHYGWMDRERGMQEWSLVVAQSVVGDDRTFSMEGAVPAGEGDKPEDPLWKGVLRWRLDREGKTFFVYSSPPDGSTDTFIVFTAERKCIHGKSCPLTHYWCTDIDFSLARHQPGSCPMGVPWPGVWKLKGPYRDPNRGW